MGTQLITLKAVTAKVSLGRSTLYRLVASGQFPKPVRVGSKAIRWVAAEVDDWIEVQAASR